MFFSFMILIVAAFVLPNLLWGIKKKKMWIPRTFSVVRYEDAPNDFILLFIFQILYLIYVIVDMIIFQSEYL